MKTIELVYDKNINEFELSKYKNAKKLSIDDIANKIAIKNGVSIDEIKKQYRSELELKHKEKFNLFLEKTIIGHISTAIKKIIVNDDINPFVNEIYTQHQTPIKRKYDFENKTFEIQLRSNQQILAHKKLWKMRYYEHRTTNLDFMDDTVIPSSVKYWSTPIGKKEVKLIEKTLEDLGKIKLEIYDVKGKKIETLYIKYKK
jgi:hypothetical protein